MIFVDTNYFLRFLLEDINSQSQKAKNLFLRGAKGEADLCTSIVVFFEIYWVLIPFYKHKKEKVAKILSDILKMKFMKLEESELLEDAVQVYSKTRLGLEDSYNLVYSRHLGCKEFKTFDKKLQKAS